MSREPLCPVPYCPAPADPDAHLCLHCRSNVVEHHHTKGRGAHTLDTNSIVIICRDLHDRITRNKYRDRIIADPDGNRYYHVEHGDEVIVHAKIPYGGGVHVSSFVQTNTHNRFPPAPPPTDPLDVMLASKSETRSHEQERGNPAGQLVAGRESTGLLARHGISIGPKGLSFPATHVLAYEDWADIVAWSMTFRRTFQWALADALIYGEDVIGEGHSQILDSLAESPGTIANWCSVARAWPHSFRNERLSFGHHQAIATIARRDVEEAAGWLTQAEQEGWTARELRTAAGLSAEREPRTITCPTCGTEFKP